MAVWTLRVIAALLLLTSAFGFLNAFYFRLHGPGGDFGVVAGVLALLAWAAAHWEQMNDT
jgi:multisubunit Na+/H+ antiporter MnhG subunit